LTDPLLLIQVFLTGQVPEVAAIFGALIVILFYIVVGGRVFCSWVCPVNMITDTAAWLRRRLGIRGGSTLSRNTRYWALALVMALALATGTLVWELFNPVSMLHRGIIFGIGMAWVVLLGVFLFDFLVARHGWCGHVCPVGAFYGLLGTKSLVRVSAVARSKCDDCMDCFEVCPEPQVIRPALKGGDKGVGPAILDSNCTNCGRCIDVCHTDVFCFGGRSTIAIDSGDSQRQGIPYQKTISDGA
jgi:ferredoxin-type protein NapH